MFMFHRWFDRCLCCLEKSQSRCILVWSVNIQYFLFTNFFELGGIWKKQNDKNRLSNFYNWLFICILYQWSFLYWKLKKKIYIGKNVWPLNVALPCLGLELGLLVVSRNFGRMFCHKKNITFNSFTWSLYMFLTSLFSYILMGLGSSKSW